MADRVPRNLCYQNLKTTEYEVICVNDGSTDGSGKIVDEFAEKYPQIIAVHKENGGVSAARNEGIDRASGEYIWFVDGDDFIKYNCLKDIADCLKRTAPDELNIKPLAFKDGEDTTEMKKGNVVADETTDSHSNWLWTRIFRKELIVQSGVRFNSNARILEDTLFGIEIDNYIVNSVQLDEICYLYRIRENSSLTKPVLKKVDVIIASCNEFQKFKERCPNKSENADIFIYRLVVAIITNITTLSGTESKKYIELLKKNKLFPLKRNKKCDKIPADFSKLSFSEKIRCKLKNISYTRYGYHLLRFCRSLMSIKRRIIK